MTAAAPETAAVGATARLVLRGPLRGLPREVAVMSVVAFFVAAGFGIVAPAIPIFARQFGVSRAASGAVLSAFALMRLVSALGCGRLVTVFGSRRVLAVGIGLVAVSSALAGIAQSYLQLVVLRGIGGVGSAMFTISASALLLGATSSAQRGRSMGAFQGGFLVGGITGPALGGVITGISVRAPFFVYAATLAAAGTVGFAFLPRHRSGSGPAAAAGQAPLKVRDALRLKAFRAAAVANFADSWGSLGVRSSLIPLLVVESLHRSPVWTGIAFVAFTAGNVVTLVLGGRSADVAGRRPLLIGGCGGCAVGCLLLALTGPLWLLLVAMAVFGLASGLLDVAPGAVLGDVGAGRGGMVVATYQMTGDAGSLIGPLAAGALADGLGFGAAFGLTAAIFLVAAAVAVRAPETLARAEPRPASAQASG